MIINCNSEGYCIHNCDKRLFINFHLKFMLQILIKHLPWLDTVLHADTQKNKLKSLFLIKFSFQGDTDNILCNIMVRTKEKKTSGVLGKHSCYIGYQG